MVSQYAIEAKGQTTTWVKKNANGELVTTEQTQDERAAQIVIPKRGEYRLRVAAFAEPFELARSEQYGGGMQKMTRLLLTLVGGPGDGKQTTLLAGWSIGSKSNLGKVFSATTGKAPAPSGMNDPVEMLNKEFIAFLAPSDALDDAGNPRYTVISWDTVAPAPREGADAAEDLWK